MKLLFIGVSPSAALQELLSKNALKYETHKSIPSSKHFDFDFIAFKTDSEKLLSTSEKLRSHAKHAWIAAILPETQILFASTQKSLLDHDSVDDFWVESCWEGFFLFSIKRMVKLVTLQSELSNLKKNYRKLQDYSEEINEKSNSLVGELESDIQLASSIQRTLLPKRVPSINGVSITTKYLPAAAGQGGDYFDIFDFGDKKRLGLLIADSQTHTLAANLLAILVKLRLEELKEKYPNTQSFVTFIQKEMESMSAPHVAKLNLFYGILDRSSLSFEYTLAGHVPLFLWRQGGSLSLPTHRGPALGAHSQATFGDNIIHLKPGDHLLLHTDGLSKILDLKKHNREETLQSIFKQKEPGLDPLDIQNELLALTDSIKSKQPLPDDITLIQVCLDQNLLYLSQTVTSA